MNKIFNKKIKIKDIYQNYLYIALNIIYNYL